VIGDRAYAADPERVGACGAAFVTAALAEGLLPVAKHFPGHGRTAVDSHLELPAIGVEVDELERVELRPFRRALAAGCPAVMVAHLAFPALDPVWPASLSPAVIGGLLRGRLGFDGLVVGDDLEMQAVARTWGVAASAVRFLEAGGDLALVCRGQRARAETIAAIEAALSSGRVSLSPAAARQARLRALLARPRPEVSVIGCVEHRELADEVLRRGAHQASADA
jgi:beta-N-acetylhexosaminidase